MDEEHGSAGKGQSPALSVVVVARDISVQLRRTLVSLSTGYQRDIEADEYEVIVVDNGSTPPIEPALLQNLVGDFRLTRVDEATGSPAQAIERGLAAARGDLIGVIVDGARLVTPGLLHSALDAARLHDRSVVAALGWNLGFDSDQRRSVKSGYDKNCEEGLLAGIGWPDDGYRLFEIAVLDPPSRVFETAAFDPPGHWLVPEEASILFLRRQSWKVLGSIRERSAIRADGFANADLFARAVELPEHELVLLLSEGTFHQVHAGVGSDARPDAGSGGLDQWCGQDEAVRDEPPRLPALRHEPRYLGTLPSPGAAHLGLATRRMPGDMYYSWLERLHAALMPDTYVEIGVSDGSSLALARRPTRAFGVDPQPRVTASMRTDAQVFPETSDDFFARRSLSELLGSQPVSFAFIDGLHIFEQVLKDFMNLEPYCGPGSVVVLHDTVPLNEATQTRVRRTQFWSGDVWKFVLCLRHYRPDLDIFTIATAPTGLTVVTGLDPSSRVLPSVYDEAVGKFLNLPFSEVEGRLEELLNVVPNDWDLVTARLKARGIRGRWRRSEPWSPSVSVVTLRGLSHGLARRSPLASRILCTLGYRRR